jgi:type IV secretory pathway ATPase VirB11/archaellum biosynthesis ATPase
LYGRRYTIAEVSNEFLDYQYQVLGVRDFMASPEVTEICINRPGELYLENRGGWQRVEVPSLTFERARQFCTSVVNESKTGQRITDMDPVVSLTFPTGQRAQFVIPPACEAGKVSITIRMPSRHTKTLASTRKTVSSIRFSKTRTSSAITTASCWTSAPSVTMQNSSRKRFCTRRTSSSPAPPAAARLPS